MTENKKFSIPKIKLKKTDILAIVALLVFMVILSLPTFVPKDDCEVARPDYKCATFEQVMIENCEYWGEYSCDTDSDVSLIQVEWYISSMCDMQNKYHNSDLDCSRLQLACNQISGSQLCPLV